MCIPALAAVKIINMEKITLQRKIKIWITPVKNTWWILNITGTKTPGGNMTIDHIITEYKDQNNHSNKFYQIQK